MTYSPGNRVLVQGTVLARVVRTWNNSSKYMVRRDDGQTVVVPQSQLSYIGRPIHNTLNA